VIKTDADSNTVTVGYKDQLRAATVSIRSVELNTEGERVNAVKLRYRSKPVPCRLAEPVGAGIHQELELALLEPVYGVAPGQVACLLDEDTILGWATIA
jgi:tRNA-specific 2-thiouridylase